MSRTWVVIRREFTEMTRTRGFLIGTILTPLLMVGIFALQIFFATSTGSERERNIVVVDLSGEGLDRAMVGLMAQGGDGERGRITVEVVEGANTDAEELRTVLLARVAAEEIDGFLWIPDDVLKGGTVSYDGKNASSLFDMERLRGAVQTVVQGARLAHSGIDPAEVGLAMQRVPFDARRTGGRTATGTTGALMGLAYFMGLAIYMVVIIYGVTVMRGVLEEKRDRIIEVIMSSIRAEQLMVGKVLGIGAAGLLQVGIWATVTAFGLTQGNKIAAKFGATLPELPSVPLSVGLIFLFFFASGFLLYATLYAAVGAIATTEQEAGQIQTPVIFLLVAGIMMMAPVMMDPNGSVSVIGSLVPFTAPIVMPMGAAVTEIAPIELLGSVLLILGAVVAFLWIAARIYRIGMLSTGRRPTMKEVIQWVRVG